MTGRARGVGFEVTDSRKVTLIMTTKAFVLLETALIGLGMLIFSPSANPTVGATTAKTPNAEYASVTKGNHQLRPIAAWECTTSWYGEDFDGQPTANGETYDMYAQTAAHPTLPLGSIVRVVNPKNHRSEIVRINDRGPYIEGRELDVSYAVARKLGFEERGTAKVRLELLKVPSRPDQDHHN
jgi:rare lipoprotein A (peptidoglycan hydrolase)